MIEVQRRIEEQREAAVRLMPPHRVVGEHHDVAFAHRDVNHRWFADQFAPAGEHSANEQVLLVSGESQNDSRSHFWWSQLSGGLRAELLGDSVLARRSGRLRRQWPAALYDIRIVHTAAA